MSIDRSRRITFEEVADIYDEASQEYPQALIDDVLKLSGIPAGGRILEIGCGPGNATMAFARRGYPIVAVELGERLAALAAYHCRDYPQVEIVHSAFEDWELEANSFDLAIAADAFHWIPPEVGYPKVAQALKSSGTAAFFWTMPVDPQTEWSRAVDQVYQDIAPELPSRHQGFDAEWLLGIIESNFQNSGRFGPVTLKQYFWTETYTRDGYIKRLRTFSSHRDADEELRQRLYRGIGRVIERFGGQVDCPLQAALFLATVQG